MKINIFATYIYKFLMNEVEYDDLLARMRIINSRIWLLRSRFVEFFYYDIIFSLIKKINC